MAGYGGDTPRRATGTYMPLFARCTIFWDNGRPNVLVTADVLGFARPTHRDIRDRVVALGVASSSFALCATHTHSGPALNEKLDPYISYAATDSDYDDIRAYTGNLADAIVALVRDTLTGTRIACTLDYKVTNQGFSRNRAGLPYTETDVPVLTARNGAGTSVAVIFSYGCHPVSAGGQTLFDPDYPGEAVSWIEDETGAFAQFIPGPAGDQDPIGERGWDLRNNLGSTLGHGVINAMETPGRTVGGPFSTNYREIKLPLDINLAAANLAAVAAAYETRAANSGLGWLRRHAGAMAKVARAAINSGGPIDTTVPLPLQVWKLSGAPGLTIALTGGEIVSGYAAYFRQRFGGSSSLIFGGYTNEVPCYIPSDELLARNETYEGGKESDFPGIAGGSMTVYNWFGHLRGRSSAGSPDGVEQMVIANLEAMLS
jgi:hypothetical protein